MAANKKCPSCGKPNFVLESGPSTSSPSPTFALLVKCANCGSVVGAVQQDTNSDSIDAILDSVRELARKMGQKLSTDPN